MANEQEQLVDAIRTHLRREYGDDSMASMRRLFDAHDKDGDGKIDKDELGRLLKAVEVGNALTRGAWVRGMIDKLDDNADRTISWAELTAAVGLGAA
jgi:Ca2+-binding EF-hand superfamily protein